jgi:alpha-1,3-fucosyltransferase
MVSNCGTHSERENFVEELQQFVNVDIYGECGPLKVKADQSQVTPQKSKDFEYPKPFINPFIALLAS